MLEEEKWNKNSRFQPRTAQKYPPSSNRNGNFESYKVIGKKGEFELEDELKSERSRIARETEIAELRQENKELKRRLSVK